MKSTGLLIALLLALPLGAEEITVDKLLAAQSFGVSAEALLAKVNDPGTTVPNLTPADVEKLRAAKVAEPVVAALLAKAPPAAAAPPTTTLQPDNPRLVTLVKAVQAGTSESLLIDQIKQTGVLQRPSLNDLIYMKENKVPEGIIRALMDAPIITDAVGVAAATNKANALMPVPAEIEVNDLVWKTGLTKKNRNGKLVLKKDKIQWLDGTNQADTFAMFPAGLKAVRTQCIAPPEGKFCHEVEFQMSRGDDFAFTDAKADVGGNESIKALLAAVKALYPKLPIVEKVK
jgi:hypothetical protein